MLTLALECSDSSELPWAFRRGPSSCADQYHLQPPEAPHSLRVTTPASFQIFCHTASCGQAPKEGGCSAHHLTRHEDTPPTFPSSLPLLYHAQPGPNCKKTFAVMYIAIGLTDFLLTLYIDWIFFVLDEKQRIE